MEKLDYEIKYKLRTLIGAEKLIKADLKLLKKRAAKCGAPLLLRAFLQETIFLLSC